MSMPSPPLPVARKHVLLDLLVAAEHERLGLHRSPARVDEVARWVRARHDLMLPAELHDFLARSGLGPAGFHDRIRALHDLSQLQEHHRARIDQRLPRYRAVFGVRDWLLRRAMEAGQ